MTIPKETVVMKLQILRESAEIAPPPFWRKRGQVIEPPARTLVASSYA
jgi:hypothetical protein